MEPIPAQAKGIGNSTTVQQDIETGEDAYPVLMELAESVGSRLRKEKQLAGMVSCEIKYNTFQSVSHQTTLSMVTDSTTLIYETARHLFNELWDGTPIRLLGIRTSKLCDITEPVQLSLFDMISSDTSVTTAKKESAAMHTSRQQKQEKLDKALDKIKNKYGKNAIIRGSLLSSDTKKK